MKIIHDLRFKPVGRRKIPVVKMILQHTCFYHDLLKKFLSLITNAKFTFDSSE